MESIVKESIPEQIVYPRLMKNKHSGAIYIFTELNKGFIIDKGRGVCPIGYQTTTYSDCIPFNGEVTLKN